MTQMTATLPRKNASDLPRAIVDTLRRAIRRRRNVILLRGLLGALAVAIGSLLAVMAVDAVLTIFSSTTRWLLTGGAVAATIATFCWLVLRPLGRHMTLARIARMVETHHPELEERISSAVELLMSSDSQDVLGSEALIAELTKEATAEVSVVEPAREFTARSARPYLLAVCCVAAVLSALMFVWPQQISRLLNRAALPYARIGNLGERSLKVTPGDTVIALGEFLRVDVAVKNGNTRSAELLRDEAETGLAMTRLGGSVDGITHFTITVPSGETNFQYRVLAGSRALSRRYNVIVTPRPAVSRHDVTYDFPEYSGLVDGTEQDVSGQIEALVGSTVTVQTTFNKELKSAELLINGKPVVGGGLLAKSDRPTGSWQIKITPETTGEWSLKLIDLYGLGNLAVRHRIRARTDAAPRVTVTEPKTSELKLHPTDRVPIAYEVREDVAVSSAELLVRTGDGQAIQIPIDVPRASTVESGVWIGRATLDLGALELGLGVKHVRVQVRVADNLPPPNGPQFGLSRTYTLVFDEAAESYVTQWVEAKAKQVATGLNEALKQLKAAKARTVWLKAHLATAAPATEPTDAAADAVRRHTAKADDILRTVAEEARPEFLDVATKAFNIADEYVGPARKEVEIIKLADSHKEQLGHAASADEYIGKAIAGINEILGGLKEETERVKRAQELAAEAESLAEEHEMLREKMEALLAEMTQKEEILAQVLAGQREVARETAELAADVDAQSANPGGDEHKQAAQTTQQAADKLKSGDTKGALEAGKKAADNLGNLKKKLDKPASPAAPAANPKAAAAKRKEMAEKADELAKRQDRLNKEMDAIEKGDIAKALEEMAKDVTERTEKLAEDIAEHSDSIKPESATKKNAEKAAEEASKAAEKDDMAMADMGHDPRPGKVSPPKVVTGPPEPSESPGGNPDGGQGTKGGGSNTGAGQSKGPSKSNNNINNTIGPGKNLGKATITPDSTFDNPSDKPGFGSGTIVEEGAEEALRRAMAALQNNPESKGMGGLGGENDDLAEGAEGPDAPPMPGGEPGDKPGMPGKPGGKPGKGGGKGAKLGAGPGRVARLRALGITSDDWLSLPSKLREGIINAADKEAPQEYRTLVKRYFRALSQRGSEYGGRGSR